MSGQPTVSRRRGARRWLAAMTIPQRVARLPWPELHEALDAQGFAQTPAVLTAGECRELRGLYENGSFRSTITMAHHRFGDGEYRYDRARPAGDGLPGRRVRA